jgi:ABC-type transporter Mla subunit MlaD
MNQPIDRLTRTMDGVEGRIGAHLTAFGQLTQSMREAEQTVVRAVTALHTAAAPLTRVGEGMSGAVTAIATGVEVAARSLSESQQSGQRLADELRTTLESLRAVWAQHESRFNGVDHSVTRILESIIGHAEAHGEALRDHVVAIDTHLSHTVNTLAANIDSLQEVAVDLTAAAQGLERFGAVLTNRPAA